METTTLTSLLRQTAAENPEKAAIMDTIADTVETLVRRRYSVRRMVSELEPLAQDREVMRLVVEAFKSHVPLPALTLRDYRPCMVLIAFRRKTLPSATCATTSWRSMNGST